MSEEDQKELQILFEELETHWFTCSRIKHCEVCELIFQAKQALQKLMS